jgi:hypothetical protein
MKEGYQDLIAEALDEIDPEVSVAFPEGSADEPAVDIEIIKDVDTPFEERVTGTIANAALEDGSFKDTLKILVNQLDVKIGVSDSS